MPVIRWSAWYKKKKKNENFQCFYMIGFEIELAFRKKLFNNFLYIKK